MGILSNHKRIYLDYASSAPLLSAAQKAMRGAEKLMGNPSSIHREGVTAKKILEEARAEASSFLRVHPDEIVFTSGGTESCNMAIYGTALGKHIVTSSIEHPAVLEACRRFASDVTYIEPNKEGSLDPKKIYEAIRPDTALVSIAYANNEIGTVQEMKEIAKVIRRYKKEHATGPLFHTDACQATGYLEMNVEKLGVDLLSLNGTKIGGPKGSGLLYVKRGTDIKPFISGGGQENGLRSGTENLPVWIGLTRALKEVSKEEGERVKVLRDYCTEELQKQFKDIRINGSLTERLPNNINLSLPGIDSELLVIELDARGIAVSAGSACSSVHGEASHVLEALYGKEDSKKYGTIRVSLGRSTRKKHIDMFLKALKSVVKKYEELC